MDLEVWDILVYGGLLGIVFFLARKYFLDKTEQTEDTVSQIPVVPPKIEKRDFTLEELKEYDGRDPQKPILLAVKGVVYDVTSKAGFYGPGGGYHVFAGKDASRALAKGVVDEEVASNPSIDDLTPDEKETLEEWAMSYQSKYEVIGKIIPASNVDSNN